MRLRAFAGTRGSVIDELMPWEKKAMRIRPATEPYRRRSFNRFLKAATAAVGLAIAAGPLSGSTVSAVQSTCGIDLKLLVMSADAKEADLPAIQRTLDYLGTPYDLVVAAQEPAMTPGRLSNGCHGFYRGIIFTTGDLVYQVADGTYQTAFEPGEQAALDAYAAQFGARELIWYSGWTSPAMGFNWPSGALDTTLAPLQARFTRDGAAVFARVNTSNPITIANAYTYLTTAFDLATVPLLMDGDGHVLGATRTFPDGRELLALTFDSNPYLRHNLVLGYDLVNWVMKGLFLGERHAYMSPQVDDLFLANQMWSADTPCETPVDRTSSDYRMRARDYAALIAWQTQLQRQPQTSGVKITWAFNGWGASGVYAADDLTTIVTRNASLFYFVSHTWDHESWETMSSSDVAEELRLNSWMGKKLKLGADPTTLVTPDVSGLKNPDGMRTAYALGVRYVVTDTSQPGYSNPTPNTGLWNPLAAGLFMIPRYPTNMYFNVSTPAEWVAEYNCVYRSYWGRDFTYQDVLDNISDTWLSYLLNGDLNPLMFHQPNTRSYDGTHSLLGDLINLTAAKYRRLVRFPILSPTMRTVGDRMIARERYNAAGVTATLVPDIGLVLSAHRDAVAPITGLKIHGAESYAGQSIAYVTLAAGQTKTVAWP